MSEGRPKGAPGYKKVKFRTHKDLPSTGSEGPMLEVSHSSTLRVDYVPTKLHKKMFENMVDKEVKKFVKDFKKIGLTVKVDRGDLQEMANTLYSFAGQTYAEVGGAGFDFLTSAYQGSEGHKKHWKNLAEKAVHHMKIMAYKTPKERRGGRQMLHTYGKSADKPYKGRKDKRGLIVKTRGTGKGKPWRQQIERQMSWVAGYYKGPEGAARKEKELYEIGKHSRQVMRSGKLRSSIGYTLDYDSGEEGGSTVRHGRLLGRFTRKFTTRAFGFRVGPGAGNKKAPPYAWAANYGRAPIKGVHYTPQDYFDDNKGGALTKGGTWPGFEGKFYLEETIEWLRRQESKGIWTPKKYARVHIAKALRETRKRFPDLSKRFYAQLEVMALDAIMNHDRLVSEELVKKLVHEIKRTI